MEPSSEGPLEREAVPTKSERATLRRVAVWNAARLDWRKAKACGEGS